MGGSLGNFYYKWGEVENFVGGGGGGGGGKKSLDIVDRGVLTPLFHEKPLILPIPPF